MGRLPNNELAICPVCKYDFTNGGKDRYRNLKRHIEKLHPGMTLNITNNNYSNCHVNNNNIIVLTNLGESQILKLLDEKTLAEIDKRLLEGENMALFLFDRIHCDPEHPENHNVVIPNLSKNEMLVYADGKPKKYTKLDGAKMAVDTFFDDEVPIVKKGVDDPVFDMAMESESSERNRNEILPDLVKHLEIQDPSMRNADTKRILSTGKVNG